MRTRRSLALVMAWLAPCAIAQAAPVGRWIGQDGHDFVGKAAVAGKSEIQDIHLAIAGLPRLKIVETKVTADGSGEWKTGSAPGSWLPHVVRVGNGPTADVYIEPYVVEKGRMFFVALTFEGGQVATVQIPGGRADPNLRTTEARMEAKWVGQDGRDLATSSPNVGPDGIQDVHLRLRKLSPKDEVRTVLVVGPGDAKWQFGPNPDAHPGAELIRDPAEPRQADLYFHPTRDLTGQTLQVRVTYASGLVDSATVAAGKSDPALKAVHAAPASLATIPVKATWLGQRPTAARPGDVEVTLEGLPRSARIVRAELSDGVVGHWADAGVKDALPMAFRRGPDPTTASIAFPPVRDEAGATMTARFVLDNGTSWIAAFPGGPADPALRAPAPAATQIKARPGDDLNDLANRYGTVRLAAGTYPMTKPLTLNRPVTIAADPGAILLFDQAPTEPVWTAAIKIHAGRTTIDGLTIRFKGPVRWHREVSYGPAVIGTTDSHDRATGAILAGLTFTRLDIEAPPASTDWEEAPKTLRLVGTLGGRIEGNRVKGGQIELFEGPWTFLNNRHDGTPPRTFTYSVLSAHRAHDLRVSGNQTHSVEPAGKTWRWLVLTHHGENIKVAENRIEGVGPRDSDKVAHPNSPETILSESYRVNFEGKTAHASADGKVLAVGHLQGDPVAVGSVVAILSGPEAGRWRRVVLPLDPRTFLLDTPLTLGGGAIAIASGFNGVAFEANSIDATGSREAMPFVLEGNHFGTKVANNRTVGGRYAFLIAAPSSEYPVHWGWSHTPMFGIQIEGNTFADAWQGAQLGVIFDPLNRTTRGRVYMSSRLVGNTFSWSDAFLAAKAKAGTPPLAIEVGWKTASDPAELIVEESANRRIGGKPGPSARVDNATINGRSIKQGTLTFPVGPTGAATLTPTRRR